MIDIRLGVVGAGVVGSALARAFLEHVREVCVFDKIPERRTHPFDDVLACEICFLCLPTPQQEGGLACDTSYLTDFFAALTPEQRRANLVIRSTVPIGFTRRVREEYGLTNLCHSPEWLTARCAMVDAQMPSRNVIGTPSGRPNECDGALQKLYRERWPHVPIFVTDSDTSEASKTYQNSFFAVKVGVFNEFQMHAAKAGVDWEVARQILLTDGRIHPSHTQVPGHDGKFGFGPDTPNNCLRKDLASLVHQMEALGLFAAVTGGAHARNRMDRERTS
jgi:UDP-glucose 6-dehydrogenase